MMNYSCVLSMVLYFSLAPALTAGELTIIMHNLVKNNLTQLDAERENSPEEEQANRVPGSEIVTVDVNRTADNTLESAGLYQQFSEIKNGTITIKSTGALAVNINFFRRGADANGNVVGLPQLTNSVKGVVIPETGKNEMHVIVPLAVGAKPKCSQPCHFIATSCQYRPCVVHRSMPCVHIRQGWVYQCRD